VAVVALPNAQTPRYFSRAPGVWDHDSCRRCSITATPIMAARFGASLCCKRVYPNHTSNGSQTLGSEARRQQNPGLQAMPRLS